MKSQPSTKILKLGVMFIFNDIISCNPLDFISLNHTMISCDHMYIVPVSCTYMLTLFTLPTCK